MKNFKNALLLVAGLSVVGCVDVAEEQPEQKVPIVNNEEKPQVVESVGPPTLSIDEGFYSLNLKWKSPQSTRITGIKIYRGYSKTSLREYATLSNTTQYLDTLVGVRDTLFYTIAHQLSDGKLSTFSDTVSKLPKEPINTSASPLNEIGGIHYAWWEFPKKSFKTLTNTFTIHEEPSNGDGIYYTMYQGEINNIGFYFGIQTKVFRYQQTPKKGLIFSRWGTRDKNNYAVAPGGWGESAGYEGDFIGVRKNYEWTPGTYKTILQQDSTVNNKDWYSVTIQKLPNGEKVWIGSIAFEQSSSTAPGSNGIKSGGVNWTEVYWKEKFGTETPSWHVSMDEVLGDNQKPVFANILYSNAKFTKTSNTFTRGSDVHFIMGTKVQRFHKERRITFTN